MLRSKHKQQPSGHFPLGGISSAERHFLLFKDQLAESRCQKTKENIIPRRKFRLVEDGVQCLLKVDLQVAEMGHFVEKYKKDKDELRMTYQLRWQMSHFSGFSYLLQVYVPQNIHKIYFLHKISRTRF